VSVGRDKAGRQIVLGIIEDDTSYRRSLGRLCRLLGFVAIEFESGVAFLATLDAAAPQYDCLLIDKMMPSMTGLELHRNMIDRALYLPTVLITGDADAHTRSSCAVAGLVACLEKPIEADVLRAVVELATGGRVATR
jgi:FixJ family two-component response regulator